MSIDTKLPSDLDEESYNRYLQDIIRQQGMDASITAISAWSRPKKFELAKAPIVGTQYKGGPVGMPGQLSPQLGFPGTIRRR